MKSDDQHEIALRESPCSEPLPISVTITIFYLQQHHKYYRFFDCYIQLLANEFTQDEKES